MTYTFEYDDDERLIRINEDGGDGLGRETAITEFDYADPVVATREFECNGGFIHNKCAVRFNSGGLVEAFAHRYSTDGRYQPFEMITSANVSFNSNGSINQASMKEERTSKTDVYAVSTVWNKGNLAQVSKGKYDLHTFKYSEVENKANIDFNSMFGLLWDFGTTFDLVGLTGFRTRNLIAEHYDDSYDETDTAVYYTDDDGYVVKAEITYDDGSIDTYTIEYVE